MGHKRERKLRLPNRSRPADAAFASGLGRGSRSMFRWRWRRLKSIAECLSTLVPNPVEMIQRDSHSNLLAVYACVDWLNELGVRAYFTDNCVVIPPEDRDLLDTTCKRLTDADLERFYPRPQRRQ